VISQYLKVSKRKITLPISYVLKEIISAKRHNLNVFQATATLFNSIMTNLYQIHIRVWGNLIVAHVNGAPHERILANVPPIRTHIACILQNFNCTKPLENVWCDVSRKVKANLAPLCSPFSFSLLISNMGPSYKQDK
jgi:hypothetical protein